MRTLATIICVLGATGTLTVAADAATSRPQRRCSMPGKTVLRTSQIRVVKIVRPVDEGGAYGGPGRRTILRGCAFATNRVRELGTAFAGEYEQDSIALEKHAGTWVSTASRFNNRAEWGASTSVVDLRTGHRYLLNRWSVSNELQAPRKPARSVLADQTARTVARYFLNDRGQVAAALQDLEFPSPEGAPVTVVRTHIVAVSSTGAKREVDSGTPDELPAASLFLDYRLFIWTHSGLVRYAFLSG